MQQTKETYDLLYATPHFSASLIPYITQKATITTQSGNYAPTSTSVAGAQGGINYHLHFNPKYSLIVGFHAGVGGRNHHLFIPKEEFTPHLERNIDQKDRFTRTADLYFTLPLLLERRWQHKGGNHWNITAGINVRHVTESFYEYYSYYGNVNVEKFILMVGNKRKPWVNYNLGGGYSWLLPNLNFFRLNLMANYSNTDMVSGEYTITVTGKEPTIGRYTANMSYIGLSGSYILTGANKRSNKLKGKANDH